MLKNFKTLEALAKTLAPKTIVAANPLDEASLLALAKAGKIIDLQIILIGEETSLQNLIKEKKIKLTNYQIINKINDDEIAEEAVKLVKEKQNSILMKGLISTNALLKAVVNRETGIRAGGLLSHVGVFSLKNYHKLLFASDCAMNINPTYEQKIALVNNLVKLFYALGYQRPKIGVISSVEKVNEKISSSVEAKALKDYFQACTEVILSGPFALDNAISKFSANLKGIDDVVAGDADGLLFPDLDSGNTFYKASIYLAEATVAGLIIGATVPIVLTSRADSLASKYYSIILAGVYSENG